MEFSTLFGRHFARLLWLLLHEPSRIEEQKAALRAMVALSKFGAISVESRDWQVVTNGVALPDSASGATELVAQMAVHGIRSVSFAIGPAAAHVLGTARFLATRPVEGDPGHAALAHLETIGATSVTLVLEEAMAIGASNGTPMTGSPNGSPTAGAAIASHKIGAPNGTAAIGAANGSGPGVAAVHAMPSVPAQRIETKPVEHLPPAPAAPPESAAAAVSSMPAIDMPVVPDAPPPPPAAAPTARRGASEALPVEPARETPVPAAQTRTSQSSQVHAPSAHTLAPGVVPDDGGGMWVHFSAVQAPAGTMEELFDRLDRFHQVDAVTRVLDDLVITAENAARDGNSAVVADVFHGIVKREAALTADDLRRTYLMAVRRMARPALLRAVANLLPRKRERRDDFLAVLVRAGEDGADAVIDQLTQAQAAEDRRTYFGVLLHLQAGVPALIHMLGDARWFVARNAAELLGEMRAADAEEPLKQLLRHHDDRVRRAATNALVSLESPTARQAVYDAMRDASPHVRMQAASALAGRGDERSAGTLTRALDDEVDVEVQLAIIAALGKLATPEAVQRLIKAAEPDGRMFFKRKSTALRLAAVQALADARTPPAMTALWEMLEDKDREVRDLVQRVVGPLRSR